MHTMDLTAAAAYIMCNITFFFKFDINFLIFLELNGNANV